MAFKLNSTATVQSRFLQLAVLMVGLATTTGCMDGPFYSLKQMNPYYLSQWRADEALGETFDARITEMKKVEQKIARMESVERDEWAFKLEKIIQDDPSPELRCQAIRCLAKMDSPVVDRALKRACTDEVDKVRMFACNALEQSGSAEAKNMLLTLAKSDTSNSVRQAAVDGLASFNEPEVIRSLGTMLDDQSPAIQKSAADSLAQITGEQFGGDMDRWKTLVDGLVPPIDSNTRFARGENALPSPDNSNFTLPPTSSTPIYR
ncbi:MAG: HEAT repeat domain-containing protein [Aureliella sp.]